jgi:hypothetical protein
MSEDAISEETDESDTNDSSDESANDTVGSEDSLALNGHNDKILLHNLGRFYQ